jgi:hypothetical protein
MMAVPFMPAVATPPLSPMLIMAVIKLALYGPCTLSCTVHLNIIKKHIQPNIALMKMICGMNSKRKSTQFFIYKLLNPFKITPNTICVTPRMIASFILKLFINAISSVLLSQTGSNPNGYTHSLSRRTYSSLLLSE